MWGEVQIQIQYILLWPVKVNYIVEHLRDRRHVIVRSQLKFFNFGYKILFELFGLLPHWQIFSIGLPLKSKTSRSAYNCVESTVIILVSSSLSVYPYEICICTHHILFSTQGKNMYSLYSRWTMLFVSKESKQTRKYAFFLEIVRLETLILDQLIPN